MIVQLQPTTCEACSFSYDRTSRQDKRTHDQHHQQYLDACSFLDYTPMCGDEREQQKAHGYQLLHDQEHALHGALLVLQAHYDRSLEDAIVQGYWREHPSFSEYIRMLAIEEVYHAEIVDTLRELFGRWMPGIPEGESYWCPVQ